jgi:hypothetical protein
MPPTTAKSQSSALTKRFSKPVVSALEADKIIGIRAGNGDHRFTGVWVVVVKGRVFVRPWNAKASGWHHALMHESIGTLQLLSGREIGMCGRRVRGERLLDSVDAAYGEKYHTPASRKWVRGFSTAKRRANTTELIPR